MSLEALPSDSQAIAKSRVRVRVTYGMTATYGVSATGIMVWLLVLGHVEMALGVFSGVASTTAAIFSFWFGSRGRGLQGQTAEMADVD